MDEYDEDIEKKRNANMRMMLYISLIFLVSIILTLGFYFLELEIDRIFAISLVLLGLIIFVIGFVVPRFHRIEGLLISMTGMCIVIVIGSIGEGPIVPVFGLACGFIMFFGVFLMMKNRYVEKINASAFDDIKGSWEIDEKGYVRKTDYPMHWPEPSKMKNNIYGLWIIPPLGSKKKIGLISINILISRKRNTEHEKKLIPFLKRIIEREYDNEIIENNRGIEQVIKNISWVEIPTL